MSGIYIPGMEMPTSCDACWALDDNGDYPRCRITDEQRGYNFHVREKRMDKCPLVPVPEHGRLIDADALIAWFEEWYDPNADLEICHVIDILDDNSVTPTIIPADKETEK